MRVTIDGKTCLAEKGEFIMDVAKRNNIHIPGLCYNDALPGQACCRLCMVEVREKGRCKTVASCVYPITDEIEVTTNSQKINSMRRTIIMLLAARVPDNEYINRLKAEYCAPGIERFSKAPGENCIMCGLCVQACEKLGASSIAAINRGISKKIATPYEEPDEKCIGCGACAEVCPTRAITVKQQGSERVIWNKRFELVSCTNCGEYFITREQLMHIRSKLGQEIDVQLCEKCRKAAAAQKLKEVFKNV